MNLTKVLPIVFSTLLHVVASQVRGQNDRRACRIYVNEFFCIPGVDNCPDTTIDCELEGHLYPISGVSVDWIKEQVKTKHIVSGVSELVVSSHQVLDTRIEIPQESLPALEITAGRRRRRLNVAKTGEVRMLVVKVNASDGQPDFSLSKIYDNFFGTGSGVHSLRTQIEACSQGQVEIKTPKHPNFQHAGVMEVNLGISLDGNTDDKEVTNIVNAALTQLTDVFEIVLDDYNSISLVISGCKPNKCPWGAYAQRNGWLAVYKGQYAGYNTVMMNTHGIMMGLGKSNLLNERWIMVPSGDKTCVMGGVLDHRPAVLANGQWCYNAVKNKHLEWFNNGDRSVAVSELPQVYQIIGVAEWNNGVEQLPVSVTVNDVGYDNGVYDIVVISFNRAVGMTGSNTVSSDKVLVHLAQDPNGDSLLLAALEIGEPWAFMWGPPAARFWVEVCQIGGPTAVSRTDLELGYIGGPESENSMRAIVLVSPFSLTSPNNEPDNRCPSNAPSLLPSDQPSDMPHVELNKSP